MNFVGGLLIVLVICVLFASFTKVGQTTGLSTVGWNVVRVVCTGSVPGFRVVSGVLGRLGLPAARGDDVGACRGV
jgi:hypothetical protein